MNYIHKLFFILFLCAFCINIIYAHIENVTLSSGADPSVSAEDGGKGFKKIAQSLGYITSEYSDEDLKFFGDPNAKKGGLLKDKGTRS